MSLVLDASVALAWIFGDEKTPEIAGIFEMVGERGAVVPQLWWLEVANSLTMAVRRKRIDADFRRAALDDLAFLHIVTDELTSSQAWSDTLAIADQCRLTVYDAAYLEVARRRRMPLATLDEALGRACKKAIIASVPWYVGEPGV